MTQQIQTAEVELVVDFGTARMNLGDIMHLKVGDVIPMSVQPTLEAKVDGVPVMECAHGQMNNQYAIRVERLLHSNSDNGQGD